MPAVMSLATETLDAVLNIGRPGLPDVAYRRTDYQAWLAAHPAATPAQAEAAISQAIVAAWLQAPVDIYVHVFDPVTARTGVHVANPGEPTPAQWWVMP